MGGSGSKELKKCPLPHFPCIPVICEWLWKKTQIEKKQKNKNKNKNSCLIEWLQDYRKTINKLQLMKLTYNCSEDVSDMIKADDKKTILKPHDLDMQLPYSQPVFTYSKWPIGTPEQCFHCWLWTSKSKLGYGKRYDVFINATSKSLDWWMKEKALQSQKMIKTQEVFLWDGSLVLCVAFDRGFKWTTDLEYSVMRCTQMKYKFKLLSKSLEVFCKYRQGNKFFQKNYSACVIKL